MSRSESSSLSHEEHVSAWKRVDALVRRIRAALTCGRESDVREAPPSHGTHRLPRPRATVPTSTPPSRAARSTITTASPVQQPSFQTPPDPTKASGSRWYHPSQSVMIPTPGNKSFNAMQYYSSAIVHVLCVPTLLFSYAAGCNTMAGGSTPEGVDHTRHSPDVWDGFDSSNLDPNYYVR